ncbi:MAG: hypothetical protein Q9159_004198 [Coniocarpon cinnabarinum]
MHGNMQSPQPPPPPPEPPEAGATPRRHSSLSYQAHANNDAPPLPPKPGQMLSSPARRQSQSSQFAQHRRDGQPLPPKPNAYNEVQRPPSMLNEEFRPAQRSPPQLQMQDHRQYLPQQYDPSPAPQHQYQGFPQPQHLPQTPQHPLSQQQPPLHYTPTQPPPSNILPPSTLPSQAHPQPPTNRNPAPPIDLLTLSDTPSTPPPAPPIPPNPEKDALLSAVATQLHTLLNQSLAQNASAIPALQAQQSALSASLSKMSTELSQLRALSATLSDNEEILHDSTRAADAAIVEARDRKPPDIDELLVAPTVVGEQLYRVVAEIRGIDEALFAVAKALERGRIEGSTFVRVTRQLAREGFLLKALGAKIARGMGLEGGAVG